jgi:hypothetical protein
MDGFNRWLLGVLGGLLIAAGVGGVLASLGSLPLRQPSRLYEDATGVVTGQSPWSWVVILVVAVLLVVNGLVLARGQFRRQARGGLNTLTLQRDDRGQTTVPATVVARTLARDLERLSGVVDAEVRLATAGQRPRVRVRLDLDADADHERVRQSAEAAYARLCTALEVPAVHADVRLNPTVQQAGGRTL